MITGSTTVGLTVHTDTWLVTGITITTPKTEEGIIEIEVEIGQTHTPADMTTEVTEIGVKKVVTVIEATIEGIIQEEIVEEMTTTQIHMIEGDITQDQTIGRIRKEMITHETQHHPTTQKGTLDLEIETPTGKIATIDIVREIRTKG